MEHKISNELPHLPDQVPLTSPEQVEASVPLSGPEMAHEQSHETTVNQSSPQPMPPQPAYTAMPAAQGVQQSALQSVDDTGMPMIADETDLIEKEWVLRAKEIVARTRQDPYQQNKEVERMKADYMKKRYNKDIKITED